MVTVVPMPKLGAGVYHEGLILKWTKRVGERVEAGEPIAEIETEKSVAEYVSPAAGTVLKLLFNEGDTVEVGRPILLLGEPGEEVAVPPSGVGGVAPTPTGEAAASATVNGSTTARDASPAARRLAENLKVDLSKVAGTGPGGSIMREDILKASRARPQAAPGQQALASSAPVPSGRVVALSGMRTLIAERLVKSQKETAHVTLNREVEVLRLQRLIRERAASASEKFGYNDVIVRAVAEALRRHPMMNSRLEGDGKLRLADTVDIGVAVAVEGGLITPTIRNADKVGVGEIAKTVRRLSEMARARQLAPEEYEGGTFTVTNLGGYGVDTFTPIINPPQVGILGVGRLMERPWVSEGVLRVAPTINLSLTFDHRVVDGADAAMFLDTVAGLLQDVSWVIP